MNSTKGPSFVAYSSFYRVSDRAYEMPNGRALCKKLNDFKHGFAGSGADGRSVLNVVKCADRAIEYVLDEDTPVDARLLRILQAARSMFEHVERDELLQAPLKSAVVDILEAGKRLSLTTQRALVRIAHRIVL